MNADAPPPDVPRSAQVITVVMSLGIVALGVFFLVRSAEEWAKASALAGHGREVNATVEQVTGGTRRPTRVHVSFEVDGKAYRAAVEPASGHIVDRDSTTMRIVYDTRHPDTVRDAVGYTRRPWGYVAIGLAMAAMGAWMLWRALVVMPRRGRQAVSDSP